MIRNEIERRNAEKELNYLRTELKKQVDADNDSVAYEVAEALRLKYSDIETEIREYDDLKAGLVSVVKADSLDELGALLVKARIARGWSQADLAEELDMEPQQVQRYERSDWQKASLWRLQEAAEALELDLRLRGALISKYENAPWTGSFSTFPDIKASELKLTKAFGPNQDSVGKLKLAAETMGIGLRASSAEDVYIGNASFYQGTIDHMRTFSSEEHGEYIAKRFVHSVEREREAV